MPASNSKQAFGLVCWLLLVALAAALGAMASMQAGTFYSQLVRPAWAPPGTVFGPVWSVLYVLMAIAVWLVWRNHGVRGARKAIALFVAQLMANALWSWLFFSWHQGGIAFLDIVLLWILIAATLLAFRRHSSTAALLLLPYLAWVSFALVLNLAIWRLNTTLL